MDVAALELIKALQVIDTYNEYFILVKKDKDRCLNETPNFHIVYLEGRSYPEWEQLSLPRWVRRNRPDVLHCTANTAPLKVSCPMILTLHDIIFLQRKSLLSTRGGSAYQRFGNLYRRVVAPRVAMRAELIFTVSAYQRDAIGERLHFPLERIIVTYNGVAPMFFEKASVATALDVRKRYSLPDRYLFFLGSTEPRKNLTGVLQAYGSLLKSKGVDIPDLVIKGITASFLRKKLSELSLQGIGSKIQLIDYVAFADLPVVYQLAEMLLFPSLSEGFGIPIIESMASGTPVITSNRTSMPEVAADAALYVDPLLPDSIADAIEKLLESSTLCATLVERGYQRAALFSWSSTAAIVKRCYQQVGGVAPINELLK